MIFFMYGFPVILAVFAYIAILWPFIITMNSRHDVKHLHILSITLLGGLAVCLAQRQVAYDNWRTLEGTSTHGLDALDMTIRSLSIEILALDVDIWSSASLALCSAAGLILCYRTLPRVRAIKSDVICIVVSNLGMCVISVLIGFSTRHVLVSATALLQCVAPLILMYSELRTSREIRDGVSSS